MENINRHAHIYKQFCEYITLTHNFNKHAEKQKWNIVDYKKNLKYLFDNEYKKIEKKRNEYNLLTDIIAEPKDKKIYNTINIFSNEIAKLFANTFINYNKDILVRICQNHVTITIEQELGIIFPEVPSHEPT